MFERVAKTLKSNGLLKELINKPRVGDKFTVDGCKYKIIKVDWMNEVIEVEDDVGHKQNVSYYYVINNIIKI